MDNFKRKKEAKKEKYYSSNVSFVLRILIVNKCKGWSYLQRNERKQFTNYEAKRKYDSGLLLTQR